MSGPTHLPTEEAVIYTDSNPQICESLGSLSNTAATLKKVSVLSKTPKKRLSATEKKHLFVRYFEKHQNMSVKNTKDGTWYFS